jgi:predicted  nucleic acid-binding Zn-ribbon protein
MAGLEKEIATLPKHIAQIEKTLESHIRRLDADRAAMAANQRDRKKLDGDIQLHNQKITKLREQMAGAKTNEQYKAFQNEIDFIAKEIRKGEDRILELMTESEALDGNVKKADAALKEEKTAVEGEKKQARERTAIDQTQLDQLLTERTTAIAGLPKATATTYERIKKKWGGTAIAEVEAGRCSACQLMLRPQYFQEVRKGDQLMTCESCGRFLYYNPPVQVQDSVKAG